MVFKFKKDKYRTNRGNRSQLINLYCRVCNRFIAIYQKDGPGNLRRMYLDRIVYPKILIGLELKPIKKIKVLRCLHCKEDLGTPYVYKK